MAKCFVFLISFIVSIFRLSVVFAGATINNPVIENLLQDTKTVSFISWQKDPYFSTLDRSFDTYPQNLIKSGNNLFIFINGSGRVYKIVYSKKELEFERIDSSKNFGYNIGSYGFSYENRIYNLGGYGFWRMNGQLRVFNEKAKQWDIVKLNKEIPILTGKTEGLIWYDVVGKKIYIAYYLLRNEALKSQDLDETQFVYDVMVLDLKKNEWTKLGKLNSFFKDKLQIVKPITMSPWGQLITIGDKISLLDFKNNQIFSLDVRKDQYQSLIREGWGSSFYFKDSTLFYGNNTSLDSIVMHSSDFLPTNEHLYIEADKASMPQKTTDYLWVSIPVVFMGIFVLVLKKKRRPAIKTSIQHPLIKEEIDNSHSVFDEIEVQLLQLLIKNSAAGKTTSTEEQNKLLGLLKKSPEIQKKQRSDIIISINRKFTFITKLKEPIIQKKRTDFDKRAYGYFIEPNRLNEIRHYFKNV